MTNTINKTIYFYQNGITIDTGIMPDGRVIIIEFNNKHQVTEHITWQL